MAIPNLVTRRARNVRQLLPIVRNPVELARCARVILGRRGAKPVRLRLRSDGGISVSCRPGTTDFRTLLSVFAAGYHLPPQAVMPGGVILDLGANVGYTLIDFTKRYPGVRVIGVELDEDNCRAATRSLKTAGVSAELIQAAVWVEDGSIGYGGETADGFSISQADGGQRQAEAISLPTLLRRLDVETIDYLKVDIEGAEREIFTAPLDWAACVRSMKIEIHRDEDFVVIERHLQDAGFTTRKDTEHWSAIVVTRD